MTRKRVPLAPDAVVPIDRLDSAGAGLAAIDGWQLEVNNALPGEAATVRVHRRHGAHLETSARTIRRPAQARVQPDCPWTARCGGCALQHLVADQQRELASQRLRACLVGAGAGRASHWLAPLLGPRLGYRSKARLGVRCVAKKGGVLIGFRERGSSRVADIDACRILVPSVGKRIACLRELFNGLRARDRIPQLEVAAGDEQAAVIVRHLEPLDGHDRAALEAGFERLDLQLWLQPGGPETVHRVRPAAGPKRLHYALPAFGLTLGFHPLDFTQVNLALNRRLVAHVVELLAPSPDSRVIDLFCGLGNFTLALATRAGRVTGFEGAAALVERGGENAAHNGLDNVGFEQADLYGADFDPTRLPACDRLLLDPPRSGAEGIARWLAGACAAARPQRIVYVSCNPDTLARDAAILVAGGFRLAHAGIVDMFPQTSHVESIAAFEAPETGAR